MKRGKIVGAALFSWWVFVLVAFGLAGNAFLLFKAFQAGNTMAVLLFGAFFCGACVYLYRTYDARTREFSRLKTEASRWHATKAA